VKMIGMNNIDGCLPSNTKGFIVYYMMNPGYLAESRSLTEHSQLENKL